MKRSKLMALRALIERAAASLSDGDALSGVELFPAWRAGTAHGTGDRVRSGGAAPALYRCVQAHTSQIGWEPEAAPALWTEVAAPGQIPVWRQPTGAQDAYGIGDRVRYPDADGPVYVSIVDNNTWAPDVYGWEVLT